MNLQSVQKPRIGFTGTNGKTTTILLTKFILEQCGCSPAVYETWKGSMAYSRFAEQAIAENKDCLLVEVPVDALRLKQIDGSSFQGGALTNITLDHLTSCRTPENYASFKSTFFNQLPERAKAIINADDPKALALAEEGHVDYISYAVEYPNAMIIADNIRLHRHSQVFNISVNAEFSGLTNKIVSPGSASVHLKLIGRHNIANALLATATALLFVPDLQAVADALSNCPIVHRNLEIITDEHYKIIDDAATNPAAIQAALTAITPLAANHTLLLYGMYGGGGVTLNECNARELSAWLRKHPEHELFITRSMYHTKNRHQVRISEEKAFLGELKNNDIRFSYYPDLPDAIDSLLTRADEGDLIVLLGGAVLARAKELMIRAVCTDLKQRTQAATTLTESADLYAQAIYHNPS